MRQVDTRGLSCPQPVVMTNREIKSGHEGFEILIDSHASLENIARILKKHGLNYEIKKQDNYTIYHVKR